MGAGAGDQWVSVGFIYLANTTGSAIFAYFDT
jgi:hypothetical protein